MDTDRDKIMKASSHAILEAILIAERSVKREALEQGHKDTGKLIRTMDHRIEYNADKSWGIVFAEDYAVFVNVGVSAGRVKYPISVMVAWWKRKGLPTKEAISAAWATRAKHLKEGIPTKSSSRFSKSGKRIGFVQDGLDRVKDEIQNVFSAKFNSEIQIILNERIEIEPVLIEM